ncbi:MAG: CbiX/SirB N-terminal domain-containing protein [Pseudorhodobacter sp.]|nr:CbiX/SirB N-terminal domain-containing protein [Pseudorhodobacter sp.]
MTESFSHSGTGTPTALIVAHGAPADPAPQQTAVEALAALVAAQLPGWRVAGATLAAPGALEAALAAHPQALIYPFFMAEGWFTRTTLPRRLAAAGAAGLRQLPAFGSDAGITDLMQQVALDGARAAGLPPGQTTLLIAAHGSQVSRASANITRALATQLATRGSFAAVTVGFLEEAPFLADAALGLGPALCLPFFALRAGHVASDVPAALAQAGFAGPLLPAIGEHRAAATLIAGALRRAVAAAGS